MRFIKPRRLSSGSIGWEDRARESSLLKRDSSGQEHELCSVWEVSGGEWNGCGAFVASRDDAKRGAMKLLIENRKAELRELKKVRL